MVLPHMDAVQQGSLALLAAVTGGIELLCGFGAVIGMTHWCRPPAAAERPSFGGRLLPAKRAEAAGDGCVDNRRDPKRS